MACFRVSGEHCHETRVFLQGHMSIPRAFLSIKHAKASKFHVKSTKSYTVSVDGGQTKDQKRTGRTGIRMTLQTQPRMCPLCPTALLNLFGLNQRLVGQDCWLEHRV